MNRILKRPMFKMGGSTGTGITSGLDQPQKMANGGRTGYMNGTMPTFQATGLPGFLTQFGLNLLSTPPQGNIFATAATAARDPFAALQASQVESMKTASDRKFARELAAEEREFEEGQLTRKLQSAERIAAQKEDVIPENILEKYEGNQIKAQREVDFYDTIFKNLQSEYGKESVSTVTIDSSEIPDKQIERFVKSNPQLARQVVYDVATGKAVRFVRNTQTNKFEIIPADPSDIDDTGDAMPEPKTGPDFTYLSEGQQETLKNIREASDSDFGMGFYE